MGAVDEPMAAPFSGSSPGSFTFRGMAPSRSFRLASRQEAA